MTLKKFMHTLLALFVLTGTVIDYSHAETAQSNSDKSQTNLSLDEAQQFIKQTINEITAIVANKAGLDLESRKKAFRSVLIKDFDMSYIGRFALRQHWRQLNDDQKIEYLNFFTDSTVETYTAQFDKYSSQKLNVSSARATSDGIILVTSVTQSSKPLHVVWEVIKKPVTGIKVRDISVEGVSMRITKRSEYGSLIESKGKGIQGLLEYIRSGKKIISAVNEGQAGNGK